MKTPIVLVLMTGLGVAVTTLGSGLLSGPLIGGIAMADVQPEWYNCLTREVFTPEKQAWCDRWTTLQNGTYTVPAGFGPEAEMVTVTLENGQYEQPGQFRVELVNEPMWMVFGDLNGDGNDDAAVVLGVGVSDGSAVVTVLAAVMDIGGEAQALSPVVLGERVMLNSPITIDNQRIMLPQLTQTEVINRAFVTDNNRLSELAQLPTPERAEDVPDGTIVLSQTPDYAVRVFTEAGQPYINLFNKSTAILDVARGRALAIASVDGIRYQYTGHDGMPSVQVHVASSGAQTIQVNDQNLDTETTVTGTVSYLPRIAMPPHAVLEVVLEDSSRAGAPAITLASQQAVFGDRQVPIPFELVYDAEQINPRHTYTLRARILVDGQLRFINTTHTPVITGGNPTHQGVQVDPVGT